ncbi:tetrathionate respiration response regulator TtrR [Serratia marcescens]|uniref:tetrathionate respiration response regulator TtrR n=1 Tax=Serratia TaxID=613 RepID=UPI00156E8AF8|nr:MULTISPECIES: tetrathionate respiration response regulator TtrR [Serratia]MBN5239252.1 response regulator transcription factor [Serratia marcescens]MCW7609461.1 tetrathionate respiration response regulator TtrR [Serratia bockelmannii]NSL15102.1 response regulator transcription factor [Serratia marcescens]HAV5987723.1 response regulator transcription factor [Serratia marcescens]
MSLIHLVDDDAAVTDACHFLLTSFGHNVQCWNDSTGFLTQADLFQTGIVLLDMRMPKLDGHQVYGELRRLGSTLAVVFLSGHGDVPMAVEQMKYGAVDFLQKPIAAEPLIAALERAQQVSAKAQQRHETCGRYRTLTPKERDIAQLVVRGMMNREMAERLNIALRTVEVHRAKVMEKMQAASLAELVIQLQALPPTPRE